MIFEILGDATSICDPSSFKTLEQMYMLCSTSVG